METLSPLRHLATADWIALSFLIAGWLLIGHFTENPPKGRPSVSRLMQTYRREWMMVFGPVTPVCLTLCLMVAQASLPA